MERWDSLFQGYMDQCEKGDISEDTMRGLHYELDRLGGWLKRRRPRPNVEEIDGQVLIAYLRRRTHFHTKTTVAGVASKVRCFGAYLVAQGVWVQNPMRWIKGPRLDPRGKMPRRIGAEHLKKIWEASGQQRSDYQKHLAVAMLSLLYGTGLRRGELERLNVGDWDRQEGLLKVDGRKTGCERSIPLSEGIGSCLEAYLPMRQKLLEKHGNSAETALLINRYGQRLSAQSLGLTVHRLARRAKVPLVSLHQFRHSCASDLLESGATLPEVQGLLGHKRVTTTSRYLQIADPERARAVSRHPLNDYLKELIAKQETDL